MIPAPISVRIINIGQNPLPAYQTEHSAGMDLYANLLTPIEIPCLGRKLIDTGLSIELPAGFEAQIRPRSGLALKHGITVLNSPGTIDADYRGLIKVLLVNLSDTTFVVNHGERIAQMVVGKVEKVEWIAAENLSETGRGAGGYGSTGL